jgi:hypothetical protein
MVFDVVRALVVAVVLLTFGCSTAVIHRFDQPDLRATIVGGSAENLAVTDVHGRRLIVPRQVITDIDHPGAGLQIIGALLAVAGLLLVTTRYSECSASVDGNCLRLVAPGFIGLGMLVAGVAVRRTSEQAADDESLTLEPPTPRPTRGRAARPFPSTGIVRTPLGPAASTPRSEAPSAGPAGAGPDAGSADASSP